MTVFFVIAQRKDGDKDYAVFSTIEKARAWCDTLCEETYDHTVAAPFVVDVPEFGNVPKRDRQ